MNNELIIHTIRFSLKMQHSSLRSYKKVPIHELNTFKNMCNKFNIIHFATKSKYEDIESIWQFIIKDIIKHNIIFDTYSNLYEHLCTQEKLVSSEYKFNYEYIINELNNYSNMAKEFARNHKNYLRRLQFYAKSRNCKNLLELKLELDSYLRRYVVNLNDDKSDNTYERQDWIIISRYICSFLEQTDDIHRQYDYDLFKDIEKVV